MSKAGYIRVSLVPALLGLALPAMVCAQTAPPKSPEAQNVVPHDGRHDFDFELGAWKAHVKKLLHPLTGSSEWDDLDGTVVTRSLPMLEGWNESEMRVDSIYGSNIKTGAFDPPEVGQFNGGRGEFYAQDTFQGRAIFVRYVWRDVNPATTHFEQAFSIDGGKTWETNWIYDGARVRG